jgi:hypothetical protein
MTKLVSIPTTKNEESDIEKFLRETATDIRNGNKKKVMVIALDNENENYAYTAAVHDLKASECVALLEILKNSIINKM